MAAKMDLLTRLDRAIAYVWPQHAVSRMRARAQMAIAGQWIGGRTDRLGMWNWLPVAGSADADNLLDLPAMRTRARDLQRRNPLALGAVNAAVTNVVGTGLSLRSRIDADCLGVTPEQAQEWQKNVEAEFRLFAETPQACDAESALNFYGLQSLALRSALDSGDVFALLPMIARKGVVYKTKVQLIEADRVMNKDAVIDTEELAGGVKTDSYGAPTEYHILKVHPGGFASEKLGGSFVGMAREWTIVPAFGAKSGRRNVIHLFDKRRPGQRRGVPYLAPVIETLKQLGDYSEAELRAAVVGAMFSVFVKASGGNGLGLDSTGNTPTSTPVSGDALKLAPGAIIDLAEGEDVTFANPGRPNAAFDPYVQAMLRYVGSALEIPFEVLLKHFESSYSAARASMLAAWQFFRGRRDWLAAGFCQPVFEAWLEEAIALGRIAAPGFFDDPAARLAYCGTEWIGDAPGQIDPLKEAQAAEQRLHLLLTTHADEKTTLDGGIWEETVQRRSQEEKLIDSLELREAAMQAAPKLAGNQPQPDPEEPSSPGAPAPGDQ